MYMQAESHLSRIYTSEIYFSEAIFATNYMFKITVFITHVFTRSFSRFWCFLWLNLKCICNAFSFFRYYSISTDRISLFAMIFIILYQVSDRISRRRSLGDYLARYDRLICQIASKPNRENWENHGIRSKRVATKIPKLSKTGVNHFDLRTAHAVHIWSCFSILSVELHRHLTSPYEE